MLNIEDLFCKRNNTVDYQQYVATILKLFYDVDAFTEEFLLAWDEGKFSEKMKTDFRFVKEQDDKFKEAAKPFVDWLRNADSEWFF